MDEVSKFVTPLTAPALLVTSSLILALRVRHRGVHVWLPIAASPLVAMMAGQTFTKCLPQQHSPSSKDGECEPCFPSGHTTGATAEMLTIAYVLRQESLIGAGGALALLTMPIIGGLNRLYRDRHWASDIVAGGAAGVVIASLLSALSEALIP
jgi:membrane-associated phospholipid phosphatase